MTIKLDKDEQQIVDALAEDAAEGLGADEPSPEYWNDFAARVRTRVALDQVPRRRWWRPAIGVALAAAAVLTAVLLMPPASDTTVGPSTEVTRVDPVWSFGDDADFFPESDSSLDFIERDYMNDVNELTDLTREELDELLADLDELRRS